MGVKDTKAALFGDDGQSNSVPEKDHRHGHRARLRERFLRGGATALQEYELLELLLCMAIPRRDVKPLAKELIEIFGSYAGVISAEQAALAKVPGMGEGAVAALKTVAASAQYLLRHEAKARPVLSNGSAVSDYLQSTMARLPREQFRILLLDKKNSLIADEILSDGTVDETAVYPREIVRQAMAHNASALILVHNHPSGDPSPSRADIAITKEIIQACHPLGIVVHDHLIIGRFGQTSFREQGLM